MRELTGNRVMISTAVPKTVYEKIMAKVETEGKSRSQVTRELLIAALSTSDKR